MLAAASFAAAGWVAWRYLRQSAEPLPGPAPLETSLAPVLPRMLSASGDNWLKVQPGETLLQYCHAQRTIDEILRQTRLSPDVFERDLRAALVAYAEFVQLAPASESHHHAHPGGLLAHTLEVLLAAATLRNGYLLPLGAPTETIDRQRDHWTYTVFFAALLHDIGKIMTDLRLHARDTPQSPTRRWLPISGPLTQSHATEYQVSFAPTAERDYLAHKKLSLILLQAIAPANALAFLGRENATLETLSAFLGGEGAKPGTAAFEGAKTLAAIIRQADQMSVAHNLQSGPRQRFATATAVPLIERLMSTIRGMLAQGTALPLNRDGAAGWVFDGAIFFVAKRLADKVREQIQKDEPEDAAGVPGPNKNDRLFDTWQDYGAIDLNPVTGQAIWHVMVEGEGYSHGLSVLRFPLHRLYDDPARYPAPMTGRIVLVEKGGKAKAEPARVDEANERAPALEQASTEIGDGVDAPSPDAQLSLVLPSEPATPASRSPKDRARDADPDDDLFEPGTPDLAAPMPPPSASGRPRERDGERAPSRSAGKEIQAPRPPRPAESKKLATIDVKPAKPAAAPKKAPAPVAASSVPTDELLDESDALLSRRKKPVSARAAPATVAPYAVAPKLVPSAGAVPTPLAIAFIEWVQHGLAGGGLTYNEPGSPIHFLPAGMALVSPRIFRDYAEAAGENSNAVQQQVIAAGWNVKAAGNSNILHFAVVKRDGVRAGKLSAVVIEQPERWVNPLPPVNGCIVPFEMSVEA
jgi:integrating conjugative element relaxase (TIGR03760 family)